MKSREKLIILFLCVMVLFGSVTPMCQFLVKNITQNMGINGRSGDLPGNQEVHSFIFEIN